MVKTNSGYYGQILAGLLVRINEGYVLVKSVSNGQIDLCIAVICTAILTGLSGGHYFTTNSVGRLRPHF